MMESNQLPHYNVSKESAPTTASWRIYPESKAFMESLQELQRFRSMALTLDYIISELCNTKIALDVANGKLAELNQQIVSKPTNKQVEEATEAADVLAELMEATEAAVIIDGKKPEITIETLLYWIRDYCHAGTTDQIKHLLQAAGVEVTPDIENQIDDLQFPLLTSIKTSFPELFKQEA